MSLRAEGRQTATLSALGGLCRAWQSCEIALTNSPKRRQAPVLQEIASASFWEGRLAMTRGCVLRDKKKGESVVINHMNEYDSLPIFSIE